MEESSSAETMETAADRLRAAKRVAVITGAGISAESGIPTFRGKGGLWRQYRAEDLATPDAFRRNPKLVWEWYEWRREICAAAEPNPAHFAVAAMDDHYDEFLLITQNVDGLHERAGSKRLIEIHGNIFKGRCTGCGRIEPLTSAPLPVLPPECEHCGAIIRPHIVWFGETYFPGVLDRCFAFLSKVDAVIVIGTSGAVMTPVYLGMDAVRNGAFAIDINPRASEFTRFAHLHLAQPAGEALPRLWRAVLDEG